MGDVSWILHVMEAGWPMVEELFFDGDMTVLVGTLLWLAIGTAFITAAQCKKLVITIFQGGIYIIFVHENWDLETKHENIFCVITLKKVDIA